MLREVLNGVLRGTALAASVLAIALLAGCGGDDDDASDSTVAGAESAATGTEQSGGEQSGGEQSGGEQSGGEQSGGEQSGGGGGSPEDFGEEAEGADRAGAARAVQGFLRAWADGDAATACSLMAAGTIENLEVFVKGAAAESQDSRCPELIVALQSQIPAKMLPQDERIRVTAVRLEDESGFVLYRNERGTESAFPVVQEDSAWKVNAIVGSKLP